MTLWEWVDKAKGLKRGEMLHMTWAEWVPIERAIVVLRDARNFVGVTYEYPVPGDRIVGYQSPWPMLAGHLVWIDDA